MTAPKLTNIEERALFFLRTRGPMRAAQLGEMLWGATKRGGGTAPYARPAGRLLRRLLERRLVALIFDPHRTLWRAL